MSSHVYLSHSGFEEGCSSTLRDLIADKVFTDVTLVASILSRSLKDTLSILSTAQILAVLYRGDKDFVYCDGRARKVVEKGRFWILLTYIS